MTAATKHVQTARRDPAERTPPVKSGEKIIGGAMVALESGLAVDVTEATGLTILGRAEGTVDNTAGANGDEVARVLRGCFRYANSAGGDAITLSDVGATCFAADNQTVAKTDNGGARSAAGTIFDVDAQGVWVEFK